jgi:succinate-semialdehyde dehydrogenase/glutarate-semialdehyde dehydrogenase
MRECAGEIAQVLTLSRQADRGKRRGRYGADLIEWFAEEGFRVYGRITAPALPRARWCC